jgi:sugar/nucleoside kinase (ribokinase family)
MSAGAALMDIIIQETEDFLRENSIVKGGMTLVENEYIDEILEKSSQNKSLAPGGSACNTVTGYAKLSGPASFMGSVGRDETGRLLKQHLQNSGVTPHLFEKDTPTGRVVSVVTPDGERSMLTCLGASAETAPADIDDSIFLNADMIHLEGYLFFNRELLYTIAQKARNARIPLSLDLASFTVIESDRPAFQKFVREYIDIVFANEDEAQSYTGETDEHQALSALARDCSLAVVKLGRRGSIIHHEKRLYTIAPFLTGKEAVDTTGAGDLWASGFLYGFGRNLSIEAAGNLASRCGYEVCQIPGAQIDSAVWKEIIREI